MKRTLCKLLDYFKMNTFHNEQQIATEHHSANNMSEKNKQTIEIAPKLMWINFTHLILMPFGYSIHTTNRATATFYKWKS